MMLESKVGPSISSAVLLMRGRVSSWLFRHIALIVLVLFGLLGVWVVDDYGVSVDAGIQRNLGRDTLNYVLGNVEIPSHDLNRFYGVAFELPLFLIELALGLDDTRDIYLMRHLATHLFFLAGGFFCYLLVYRLLGNRLLAVLAMLLFLLHPRLYAHSFFNSKDVPFLSMFMICLYLVHRAFGRDGRWWWFAICGIGVGLLINLRIMGVVLLVAIVAMQLLDLVHVPDGRDRKHILASVAAFLFSCLLTVYATLPFLWSDPITMGVEWFATLSDSPIYTAELFRGEVVDSTFGIPSEYIPVWMSITMPPAVLVLGAVGMSALVLRGFAVPADVLRNTWLRFWLMLIGCFILSVLAVMALGSNIYNGWRHVYFLYAPFCLLSVFGIHWIFSFFGTLRLKFLTYCTVGTGILSVAVSMFAIHPNQHVYFNFLVDRTTPEHLRTRYTIDYWLPSMRYGLSHLLERYPSQSIYIEPDLTSMWMNRYILPADDRHRLFVYSGDGEFSIGTTNIYHPEVSGSITYGLEADGVEIYSFVVYGNTIFTIGDLKLSREMRVDDVHRQIYLEATSSGNLIIDSDWDVYLMDGQLVYIRESCSVGDADDDFFLHLHPVDVSDLPKERKESGFYNLDFDFPDVGAAFDGKCMAKIDLPDYAVVRISTGQHAYKEGQVWKEIWNLRVAEVYDVFRESRKNGVRPAISSVFDVYLDAGQLVYVKSRCVAEDREARFFLHLTPADVSDLPEERKESGFDNLDFDWHDRGGELDGECFAVVDLPAYEIASISTGQYTSDGLVWGEKIDVGSE